ncbi:MAG: NADH-quinone oxidoreductase subunit J [Acidimicrobiia bacterium]|nr:MAG: NADH-quinone oxidoreductase subunit J [Acidimicrobiia bacterium]
MVEVFVFAVFALVAIGGALVMVMARNPVHSAIGLLTTMFSIAVFYVLLNAHFIAAIQVLIYAGAVMTLFLFVIMMIGVDKTEDTTEQIPWQRPIAIVVSVGLAAVILIAGSQAWITGRSVFGVDGVNGTIEAVADALFGTWTLAFLSTVFLLTIAAVGTIAMAQYLPRRPEEES